MRYKIKLLVSPRDLQEAKTVISSKVNFIDCKNPSEGSLGANFPWIIKSMKKLIPSGSSQLLSATIGDFPYLPGTASLAALGAAVSGADIIKVGLKGPKDETQGIKLMEKVVKAVKEYNDKILVVAAGYADQMRMKSSPNFLMIPTIAAKSGADIAMLDTYIKDGKCLFDFLSKDQLFQFKNKAEGLELQVALAGNLKLQDIEKIKQISPDIIGVRTVVCERYDRINGTIQANLIDELKKQLYN
jgi:uncharacterized protein (UPF0264 family)